MDKLNVKQTRLVKEQTQEACANAIGIHVNTYRNLEEHPEKFTVLQAVKLCKFLGVNYDTVIFLPESST